MFRSPVVWILSLALVGAWPATVAAAGESTAKPARKAAARAAAEDTFGRQVFQALIGEFAVRRGEMVLAADALSDLAVRTRDPKVIARAVEVLLASRYYERALELLDLWQQIEPEAVLAKQMRSTLLVLTNRTDDLVPQLAQMLAQDRSHLPGNLLQLNRLLGRQTDKKAVLRVVDRLTLPYRDLAEAHFALAQAAMAAGEEAQAASAAERAVALRPDWEMAAMLRAQMQLRQQNVAAAIAGLNDFVASHPEASEARLMLARLLAAERRVGEARLHFETLVKNAPNNPEVLYPLAVITLQQGDHAEGRRLLETLLATDFADKSTVHFFLAQLAEEAGQPAEAIGQYQQVLGGEHYVTARARAASLLQKAGRFEAARTLLRETRATSAEDRVRLVIAESALLREADRLADATAVVGEALQAQPDNHDLLYEAGMLAERRGDHATMEAYLQRLLGLKPDHAHALNALGYSFADRGVRLDESERLIQRALAILPDDPFITDSLGWVYFRQGRLEEALSTLQRAYRAKADPEIAAHIGEVLWQLGRRDEARRFLLEVQKSHPDHDVLGAVIRKLLP